MGQRATAITLIDRVVITTGEPLLDASEGVLIIQHEGGTHRTFNWDFVIDYYQMSEEETRALGGEEED
ncbi:MULTISPECIES: hypothetical protein [Mycolicibacterium]|uniref:Uncharacterized protein n=1 Tax=Mycolicibacterium aichiense TaxID=1799 RepID=A0A378VBU0_9MYCO|nr:MULTISPECIES: hypothetical protein [Mycolicibacterium]QFG08017.1 hypothetical protein SEA_HERBERTWM_48 [Mycobacterium phage Herbertwm]MCV7016773.1 hypothetical protein [Mycolicibacterium aichiense]SUA14009.1 Uncharacterised protein [Mycolicibacterium aichiense]SUA14413.1 Uncharacterised protein [Mycolicibacterium aichiense]BBX09444.1 hypothetical protein MAIC_42470 [Mycolicibacterium aichiense]